MAAVYVSVHRACGAATTRLRAIRRTERTTMVIAADAEPPPPAPASPFGEDDRRVDRALMASRPHRGACGPATTTGAYRRPQWNPARQRSRGRSLTHPRQS